jgi:hypothetical protein
MMPLALQLALHGSILLMAGLIGGLFFARAIRLKRGEVAWRVVHAGGVAVGAMLLALAVPSQWMTLGSSARLGLGIGFIGGSYLLCLGMFIAAIFDTRGIPGAGPPLNRLVAGLYGLGTVMTLAGCALLIIGLLGSAMR